jgi:hypothetical protein
MALFNPGFNSNPTPAKLDQLPAGEFKNGEVAIIYDDGNFGLTATHARVKKQTSVPKGVMVRSIQNAAQLSDRSEAVKIVDKISVGDKIHFQLIAEHSEKHGKEFANCKAAKML